MVARLRDRQGTGRGSRATVLLALSSLLCPSFASAQEGPRITRSQGAVSIVWQGNGKVACRIALGEKYGQPRLVSIGTDLIEQVRSFIRSCNQRNDWRFDSARSTFRVDGDRLQELRREMGRAIASMRR